jgi:hypothetical protein
MAAVAPAVGATHAFGDDPACEDPAFSRHPVAQVEGVLPPVTHDHCEVCHFQRTLRGAAPTYAVLAVSTAPSTERGASTEQTPRAADVSTLPSRAPPAL